MQRSSLGVCNPAVGWKESQAFNPLDKGNQERFKLMSRAYRLMASGGTAGLGGTASEISERPLGGVRGVLQTFLWREAEELGYAC